MADKLEAHQAQGAGASALPTPGPQPSLALPQPPLAAAAPPAEDKSQTRLAKGRAKKLRRALERGALTPHLLAKCSDSPLLQELPPLTVQLDPTALVTVRALQRLLLWLLGADAKPTPGFLTLGNRFTLRTIVVLLGRGLEGFSSASAGTAGPGAAGAAGAAAAASIAGGALSGLVGAPRSQAQAFLAAYGAGGTSLTPPRTTLSPSPPLGPPPPQPATSSLSLRASMASLSLSNSTATPPKAVVRPSGLPGGK